MKKIFFILLVSAPCFASDSLYNFASTYLLSRTVSTDTILTVSVGTGYRFPASGYNITVWDTYYATSTDAYNADTVNRHCEIMRVTLRSGDNFHVLRAQEGTKASNFNSANRKYQVQQGITAALLQSLGNGPQFSDSTVKYSTPTSTGAAINSAINSDTVSLSHRIDGKMPLLDSVYFGILNLKTTSEIHDDFLTGYDTSPLVGDSRWTASGSNGSQFKDYHSVFLDNVQGAVILFTTANNMRYSYLYRETATVQQTNDRGTLPNAYHLYRVRTPDSPDTSFHCRVGLQENRQEVTFAEKPEGIFFKIDTAGDWVAVCRSGGVESDYDTKISYSTSAWHDLAFSSNSAGNAITFYTDGVADTTITTHISSTYLEEQVLVYTGTTTIHNLAIDFWQRIISGLSR